MRWRCSQLAPRPSPRPPPASVWAWGDNETDQLGQPAWPGGLTAPGYTGKTFPTAIAAADFHSLALGTTGRVSAWGHNGTGQLGDGGVLLRLYSQTTSSGVVVSTDTDNEQPLTHVIAIAAGGATFEIEGMLGHSMALRSDGSVWVWGSNSFGELGQGTDGSPSYIATEVPGANMVDITAIAAGNAHCLALRSDGAVFAWGLNSAGQVGADPSSYAYVVTPTAVGLDTDNGEIVVNVEAGGDSSYALTNTGRVFAWGANGAGQLGINTDDSYRVIPTALVFLCGGVPAPIVSVSAGASHALAVDSAGRVWSWGSGSGGKLGDGSTVDNSYPYVHRRIVPSWVYKSANEEIFDNAVAVSAGTTQSMAITSDGHVWAWGADDDGEVGNGSPLQDVGYPVELMRQNNTADERRETPLTADAVAAGGAYSLALAVTPFTIASAAFRPEDLDPDPQQGEDATWGWTYQNYVETWPNKVVATISVDTDSLSVVTDSDGNPIPAGTLQDSVGNTTWTAYVTIDPESSGSVIPDAVGDDGALEDAVWDITAGWHGTDPASNVGLTITIVGTEFGGAQVLHLNMRVRLVGDIDDNGYVNTADQVELSKYLNGIYSSTLRECDLDKNGYVTTADYVILNKVINQLPIP